MPDEEKIELPADKIAELAVSVWRIKRRAAKHRDTPEPVAIACETAVDRLRDMGVMLHEHVGEPCDDAMRVRVVEDITAPGKHNPAPVATIVECLSPAVYYNNNLIRRAEVVVER